MLKKLNIKNYLIIKEAEITFEKGLNILTGETGAGKTIIIDALSLILGERADYTKIKNKNEKLIVEGQFEFINNRDIKKFLIERDLLTSEEHEETLILRRELTSKGLSRSFINDTPVNINELKELGDLIIDIHSQNEHQSLLKKDFQIDLLDSYANNFEQLIVYNKKFNEYIESIRKYNELLKSKNELSDKKNYLEYQLREINNINPIDGEDEELEEKLIKLENSEEITESIERANHLLQDYDDNVLKNLSLTIKELERISKYDKIIEEVLSGLNSSYIAIKELSSTIASYRGGLDFDRREIDYIRERLSQINFLKKKYRMNIKELREKTERINNELSLAENFDFETDKIRNSIIEQKNELINLCNKISEKRKKFSKELENNVNKYLKEVNLENAQFKIHFDYNISTKDEYFDFKKEGKDISINKKGIDDIEFYIKVNKGDKYTSLKKTASGGEISRIMLSIKAAISNKDKIPILVFDEIDTGISGRIAGKVGKLLKEISKTHQIISITHLAQIAALSENHISVTKKEMKEETIAEIKILTQQEKIMEIAKIISNDKITEIAIKNAKELIYGTEKK